MKKFAFNLFQASLFNSNVLEEDSFVIHRQVPMMLDFYHRSLPDCPKQLSYLIGVLGLSQQCIKDNKIGFCNRKMSRELPHHKTDKGVKIRGGFQRLGLYTGKGHESMRGCFTLPLADEDSLCAGVYGLRYDRPRRIAVPQICCTFRNLNIYAPSLDGEVALLLRTPFDVMAIKESGYHNGVAVLGESLTSGAVAELYGKGIRTLVTFTDATVDDDSVAEMNGTVKSELRLCKVPLPFRPTHFGKWDDFQWRLFDKRLNRILAEKGVRNERYQA